MRILADEREKPSGIPAELATLGAQVDYRVLDVADYLVGECAVERKSVGDFVSSLFDGRLFDQAYRLTGSYGTVILLVEGDIAERLEELKNPRWFWGALASVALDFGMICFFTPNQKQTAQLIYTLGRRSMKTTRGTGGALPLIVRKPRTGEMQRVQVAAVSGLPGVGPRTAKQLLAHFGTVGKVFKASVTDMAVGAGIGRARALAIKKLLDADYKGTNRGGQSRLKSEDRE